MQSKQPTNLVKHIEKNESLYRAHSTLWLMVSLRMANMQKDLMFPSFMSGDLLQAPFLYDLRGALLVADSVRNIKGD